MDHKYCSFHRKIANILDIDFLLTFTFQDCQEINLFVFAAYYFLFFLLVDICIILD